jgi:hypothetical protein
VPPLVSARMLNEYAYCPTLFFLEWMDFLWASNAVVAEGSRWRGRMDAGGQRHGHQPRGGLIRFLFLGQHEKLPTSVAIIA